MRDRGGSLLAYETVFGEAGDGKGSDQVGRPTGGDEFRNPLAGDRRGLEPVGAPADVEDEPLDFGHLPHDGRIIRGHEVPILAHA